LIWTVAPATGEPSVAGVTVPVILPQCFGGLTVIDTDTGDARYGVSVPRMTLPV